MLCGRLYSAELWFAKSGSAVLDKCDALTKMGAMLCIDMYVRDMYRHIHSVKQIGHAAVQLRLTLPLSSDYLGELNMVNVEKRMYVYVLHLPF